MGYLDSLLGNSSRVWELGDEGLNYDFGNQSVPKAKFETMDPLNRQAYENAAGSAFNIGGGEKNLGNLYGALNSTSKGPNGEIVNNQGWGGLGLGAFQAWNSWNQGNEMMDMQREAFDFSKDKFWNNMAMKLDDRDRRLKDRAAANNVIAQGGPVSQDQRNQIIADSKASTIASPVTLPGGYGNGVDAGYNGTNVASQSSFYQDPMIADAAQASVVGQNPAGYGTADYANGLIRNSTPATKTAPAGDARAANSRPVAVPNSTQATAQRPIKKTKPVNQRIIR